MSMDENQIRTALLQVVGEFAHSGSGLQQGIVLQRAAQRLGIPHGSIEDQQALLTVWHDLFRNGHLAWGYDIGNANPPFCHLTETGRNTLRNLSRDPSNPDGYMQYLNNQGPIDPIAESYIKEALRTYNNNCYKATAVMVGVAAESIVLELRDVLVTKMSSIGKHPSRDLKGDLIKKVLDAIEKELLPYTTKGVPTPMPTSLAESFSSYWPAFTSQIRAIRNDTGHPNSVDPVTPETVHAALLIFPLQVKLTLDLTSWLNTSYQ